MKTQTTFRDVNVRVHASKLKFALIFAFIFSVFQSQTYTFTGNGDGTSWTDAANWNSGIIPFIDDTTCEASLGSGKTIVIPAGTILNWDSGSISGSSTVNNNGTLNVNGVGYTYLTNVSFNNNNTVNLGNGTSSGYGTYFSNTTFTNNTSATFTFKGINLNHNSGTNLFLNKGNLIKSGTFATVNTLAFTNEGSVNVQEGTLTFSGTKILKTSNYAVATGATLLLSGSSAGNAFAGTLSGTINGNFQLQGNMSVNSGITATFNLLGNGFIFKSGTLSGPGTLINQGLITLDGSGYTYLNNLTVRNNATFNLGSGTESGYGLYFSTSTLENTSSGTFEFKGINAAQSTGVNLLRNLGTLIKSVDYASVNTVPFENSSSISVLNNLLEFSGAKTLNSGTYAANSGSTLRFSGTTNFSGTLTGNIAGTLELAGTAASASASILNFTGTGIKFKALTLTGPGSFENKGLALFSGEGYDYLSSVTFINSGTLNFGQGSSSGYGLYFNTSTLRNETAGIIEFKGNSAMQNSGVNTLRNLGTIKKTGDFETNSNVSLDNTGLISVESNTLQFSANKILNGGVYNTQPGTTLKISGTSTLQGNATGNGLGSVIFSNSVSVPTGETFTNSVSGNGIYFSAMTLNGPGQFINNSMAKFKVDNYNYLSNQADFLNNGEVILGEGTDSGYNVYFSNSTFTNSETGTLESRGTSFLQNSGTNLFTNNGSLIKKGNFNKNFSVATVNNGNIIGEEGRITFSGTLNNTSTGKISGYAIGTPAGTNFTNSGIFAPGMSPGILNVTGQLKSTNGTFEIEIDGNTPGTEYDQITYNANTAVPLSGNVHVVLGFAPNVGDEFIIVKSQTAPITSTLAAPPFVEYNGNHYYFTITNSTNEVKLTVTEMTLATATADIQKSNIYPNPATDVVHYSAKTNLVGFEIYNLAGQKLKSGKQLPKEGEIDVKTLMPGNYILRLIFADRTETHKLIKK